MISVVDVRFDDYSTSPKILLDWGCGLVQSALIWYILFCSYKNKLLLV